MEEKTFTFSELSPTAQENAHKHYLENIYTYDPSEYMSTISIFCNEFGVKIERYEGALLFDTPKSITTKYENIQYKEYDLVAFIKQEFAEALSKPPTDNFLWDEMTTPILDFIDVPYETETLDSLLKECVEIGFEVIRYKEEFLKSLRCFSFDCSINHWRFHENGMPAKENIYN